jgi:hypothetical protein
VGGGYVSWPTSPREAAMDHTGTKVVILYLSSASS